MIASGSGALLWSMDSDSQGQRSTTWFFWREGVSAADIHRQLVAVSADAAPNHKTVLQWVESFSTGHECVKKGISLSHMSTAQSLASQYVFGIMENRRITTDELQLATSLLCNNSCNYPQRFKDDEGLSTLGSKGSHTQKKGKKCAELPGTACSSKGPRGILCQTLLVMDPGFNLKLQR